MSKTILDNRYIAIGTMLIDKGVIMIVTMISKIIYLLNQLGLYASRNTRPVIIVKPVVAKKVVVKPPIFIKGLEEAIHRIETLKKAELYLKNRG